MASNRNQDSNETQGREKGKSRLSKDQIDLLSAMFLGWNPNYAKRPDGGDRKSPTERQQDPEESARTVGGAFEKQLKVSNGKEYPQSQSPKKVAAINFDDVVPRDPAALRKTELFQATYKLIQWQRDNYLVGQEYADWRKSEREKRLDENEQLRRRPLHYFMLPFDSTALGHQQFGRLAADFVPSDTVKNALLPILVDLPQTVLYDPTKNATINLILGQQTILDKVIKNSLIAFLDNPENRNAIKNSTQGYIATTYRDAEQKPAGKEDSAADF